MTGFGELRIGTCSWKYDSWIGLIYSDRAKKNYLEEYARRYTTVEVDQWFWSLFPGSSPVLPRDDTVADYAASVPEDFVFTVKVPNSVTLTHYYKGKTGGELVRNPHFLSRPLFEMFLEKLAPLHSRLGPVMFQFEYLNRLKMSGQKEFLDTFGEFIQTCPPGFEYAVETRNPRFLNDRYFRFLSSLGLGHVFLQGYYMPPVIEIFDRYNALLENSVVIRLHGPDRKNIEKMTKKVWNEIVDPRDEEIGDVSRMVHYFMSKDVPVYVNVNNHYEGSAPRTIDRLVAKLGLAARPDEGEETE